LTVANFLPYLLLTQNN